MRIGFAGLGRMGRLMAMNCAKAFPVTVWNRSPEIAADFARLNNCAHATSPAELAANTDIILSMLADDKAARDVYLGKDGLLAAEGADLLVEMGTMSSDLIGELHAKAKARGKTFTDAPVSGATQAAEEATLMIMAGASAEMAARLQPVFDQMARKTIWLGKPGLGAVMKLSVNTLIHGLNQNLSEALTLAEAAGIEASAAFDVIENSAAAAPMLKYRRSIYLDEQAQDVSFTVALARKDVRLALDQAQSTGTAMPQTQTTFDMLKAAGEARFDNRDMAAILNFMREGNE
ncbi:MAG: NAD-binding protein [Boseongicola sp.]|nr:MAG: NAD-binding protein [Boseongicola sp.]